MPLTPEQQKKLQNWLSSKNVTPNCPSCGGRSWSIGDIISSPVLTSGGTAIGGRTIPMVQVICNNCGFVRLYAAVPIGLP